MPSGEWRGALKIPNDPRALAAYQNGEKYFYARRGQLNFSCASCHVQAAGDFDSAINQAKQGEAPAKASIAQAKEQETDWTAAVIH
jgi:hypothetical protein